MAKGDELDLLLQDARLADDEWMALATTLNVADELPEAPDERRLFVNRKLRQAYGHTFAQPFRDDFQPDYVDIVRATAKKLRVPVKQHHSVAEMEQRIVVEVVDRAKEAILKEKGPEAWREIEEQAEAEIRKAIEEGRLPPDVAEHLRGLGGGALMAALLAGRLAGFGLYIVANQLFFAIARFLGFRVGVAVAGPVIGRLLSFLLGPTGWLFGVLWVLYDVGNTSWKKVIPAVTTVAIFRARLEWEGNGSLS